MTRTILVIGGGIIGVSTALELQAQGFSVRLVDRTGIATETSAGNAGAFAFTDVVPLATPGILRKAPKWLLDPLGPLSIPPAYALHIAPWMLRFWRASWADRYQAALEAQTAMMRLAQAALKRQVDRAGGSDLMRHEGQLQIYESENELTATMGGWTYRKEQGIAFDILDSAAAIAEIQPGLSPQFTHGVFTPNWINTVNPKTWTETLAQRFVRMGGEILKMAVHRVDQTGDRVYVQTDGPRLEAAHAVVTAGAWSRRLARLLGDKIPLETERGYNTTFTTCNITLNTHLTFAGHGFVATKIDDGLRIGGAVELGGLDLPPNFKRSEILVEKAQRFLPGLSVEGGTQWMGFRPSLPDSLPVIDRAKHAPRVIYAFGHGHLGLTQSAATAELVHALITDQTPEIPLTPYRASRF